MKTLPRLLTLKILAIITFIACLSSAIAFGTGAVYAVSCGYFDYPEAHSYLESTQFKNEINSQLEQAASLVSQNKELPTDTNLVFTLEKEGVTVISPSVASVYEQTKTSITLDDGSILTAALNKTISCQDSFYYDFHLYSYIYDSRYAFCIVTLSCLAVAVFLAYFLMCGAGRKRKSDEIFLNMADRLPLDLYGIVLLGCMYLSLKIAYKLLLSLALWTLFPIVPCLLVFSSLTVALINTVAKRVKNNTWWSGMLIRKAVDVIWRFICRIAKDVETVFVGLPIVWKTLVLLLGYLGVTIVAISLKSDVFSIIWFVLSVVGIIAICLCVVSAEKIKNGAQKLAEGDLSYKIDTEGMILELKSHAQNLNSISNAISIAVDERTKSEKFKAELITNVSHDIKTPITSIINYVDLLGKQNLTEEQQAQYLEVLKRQSARLKKLTEDLVEASKASTGNIYANCEPINICEMLKQSTGEFCERIDDAGLSLELEIPKDTLLVMADGRLLWRVFENLLSNICKYSLTGTRVYVTLSKENESALISFKNISRDRLSMPGVELTERFVRGDSSRSTEGSGLGLSIAKSFTEIQHGTFNVSVDGDLFKTEIRLPAPDAIAPKVEFV